MKQLGRNVQPFSSFPKKKQQQFSGERLPQNSPSSKDHLPYYFILDFHLTLE
jgi:hypothetical protein